MCTNNEWSVSMVGDCWEPLLLVWPTRSFYEATKLVRQVDREKGWYAWQQFGPIGSC
jgi:hypothetical protein